AYGDLGMWDRSLELAALLARDHPEYVPVRRLMGEALLHLNRIPAAVPHLEASLQAEPGDPQTQFELADALFQQHNLGQEGRIETLLEAVVKSGRASGVAYYELGLLYESHGRWKDAGDCFDTAAQRDTPPLVALRHASVCYRKAGYKEAAVYASGQCFER